MIFNSLEFIVFLAIVFLIYWRLDHKWQNIFLVIAGYIFYGWWDWRFLLLLITSTLVDFTTSIYIDSTENAQRRNVLLAISIFVNLAILGFFKYFGFFVASLQGLLAYLGVSAPSFATLNIILPLGISFYTFQTMGYVIDVYRRHLKPTKNIVEYMGFVTFFPHLVAGPINRAPDLLKQFQVERTFDYSAALDGCRQMLWGFFKKMVIADGLAVAVNLIYGNPAGATGWQLATATLFFAFQIYCDFSGYSDIALGTARLFGFHLMRNFNYPYFSRSIIEFWQRWHISLYTWFKDYVYTPMVRWGTGRVTLLKHLLSIFVTFVLSGLWHGANWTFVLWGALHGIYFIPYSIAQYRNRLNRMPGTNAGLRDIHKILITFLLVAFSFIFFRADSIPQGFYIVGKIVLALSHWPLLSDLYPRRLLMVGLFIAFEWWHRNKVYPIQFGPEAPRWLRWATYYAIVILILTMGNFHYSPFIYFHF